MNIFKSKKHTILINVVTFIVITTFLCQNIVWTDEILSRNFLAAESRLIPFFKKHGLDIRDIGKIVMAISKLKRVIYKEIQGDVEREIKILNDFLSDRRIKIEGTSEYIFKCSKRKVKYAVLNFEESDVVINALFIEEHQKLTAPELKELGINDEEKHHLDCPGLENVWLVNANKNTLATAAEFQIRSKHVERLREGCVPYRLMGRTVRVMGEVIDEYIIIITGTAENLIAFLKAIASLREKHVFREGETSPYDEYFLTIRWQDERREDKGVKLIENALDIAWFERFYLYADDDGKAYLMYTPNAYRGEKHQDIVEIFKEATGASTVGGLDVPTGTPVTLLRYMSSNRVFGDNPKRSSELARQRGGNDSQRTIQRELKVLRKVGLVKGNSRIGYFLPDWLRNIYPEDIIRENPELDLPNPNNRQISVVAERIKRKIESYLFASQRSQSRTSLFTMLNGVLRDFMPMVNASLVAVVLKSYPDKEGSFVEKLYDVIQRSSGLSAIEKLQEFNRLYPDDSPDNISDLAAEANELKKTLSEQVGISSAGQKLLELFQRDLAFTISVDHPDYIKEVMRSNSSLSNAQRLLVDTLGHTQKADYDKFSHIDEVLHKYQNVKNAFLVFDAVSEIRQARRIADRLIKQGKRVHVIGIVYPISFPSSKEALKIALKQIGYSGSIDLDTLNFGDQSFESLSETLKSEGADIVLSGLSSDLSQIMALYDIDEGETETSPFETILNPIDLEEEIKASELSPKQIQNIQAHSKGVFSLFQFLDQVHAGSIDVSGGYALGFNDRNGIYKAFAQELGLKTWNQVYREHLKSDTAQTDEFLSRITSTNKPIVFFLPRNIFSYRKESCVSPDGEVTETSLEVKWLLQNSHKMKNIYFVFGAYDAIAWQTKPAFKNRYEWDSSVIDHLRQVLVNYKRYFRSNNVADLVKKISNDSGFPTYIVTDSLFEVLSLGDKGTNGLAVPYRRRDIHLKWWKVQELLKLAERMGIIQGTSMLCELIEEGDVIFLRRSHMSKGINRTDLDEETRVRIEKYAFRDAKTTLWHERAHLVLERLDKEDPDIVGRILDELMNSEDRYVLAIRQYLELCYKGKENVPFEEEFLCYLLLQLSSPKRADIVIQRVFSADIHDTIKALWKTSRPSKPQVDEVRRLARQLGDSDIPDCYDMLDRKFSIPKGTPATLLRYMYANKIFSDNPKRSIELARQRDGNDSQRTIQRELRVLQDVGLVQGNKTGYYLDDWVRKADPEDIIRGNPELNLPSPSDEQIRTVTERIARLRRGCISGLPLLIQNESEIAGIDDDKLIVVCIAKYVIDNFKIVALQKSFPVRYDQFNSVLARKDLEGFLSNIAIKENFIESFGDLIIFLMKSRGEEGLSILKEMIDKLISPCKRDLAQTTAKAVELVGQLQMLCYESYSKDDSIGIELMSKLVEEFNKSGDMDVITKVAELRRKLEYLHKGEVIKGKTVESLRDMIDTLHPDIFNDRWLKETLNAVNAVLKEQISNNLKILEVKDEIPIAEIQKIHKSQRGIIWDGEGHTKTTIDKKVSGAKVYLGYIEVDGRIKAFSSIVSVKNFLRTLSVLDIMHDIGIGTRLLVEGVKEVIEDGYTSVHMRILQDNLPSIGMIHKLRDYVLRRRSGEKGYEEYIRNMARKSQEVFELDEEAGIYCDEKLPVAHDYGDPKLSYRYEFNFITHSGKRKFVEQQGFNDKEIDLAIKILDLIGIRGLKKVKQFLDGVTNNREEILQLSREIIEILEKKNTWVYNNSYYDFIFGKKLEGDPIAFLKKVRDFLIKEDAKPEIAHLTEKILKELVNFHSEKSGRDEILPEQLVSHERCANYIRDRLRLAGVETFEFISEKTGEKSIVGIVGDLEDMNGKTLIFDCHYDVVPIADRKTKEHYSSSIDYAGNVYGKNNAGDVFNHDSNEIIKLICGPGVYDMLGSIAVLLASIENIRHYEVKSNSCVFVFAPDEEFGGHYGTEIVLDELFKRYPRLNEKAEKEQIEVAILEPTNLSINTYYRGQIRVDIEFPAPHQTQDEKYVEFNVPASMHTGYFDRDSSKVIPVLKQVLKYIEGNRVFPLDLVVGNEKDGEIDPSVFNATPTCARLYYTLDEGKGSWETSRLIEFIRNYWSWTFPVPEMFPKSEFGTNGISYGINRFERIKNQKGNFWRVSFDIRAFFQDREMCKSEIEKIINPFGGVIIKISYVDPLYKAGEIKLVETLGESSLKSWGLVQNLFAKTQTHNSVIGQREFFGGTVARFYKNKGIHNIVIWGPIGFLPHAFGEFVFAQSLHHMAVTLQDLIKKHLETGIQRGAPATLLRYMYANGIYSNNPKKPKEMAKQRGSNDSIRTIQRELRILKTVGLVEGNSKSGYYLSNWVRKTSTEEIIRENPELDLPNPIGDQINTVASRVEHKRKQVVGSRGTITSSSPETLLQLEVELINTAQKFTTMKKTDLRNALSIAKCINPSIKIDLSEAQLQEADTEVYEIFVKLLIREIFIPANNLFVLNMISESSLIIYKGNINPNTWEKHDYLGTVVWTADIVWDKVPLRSIGHTVMQYAFVDSSKARHLAFGIYDSIMSQSQDTLSALDREFVSYLKRSRIDKEGFSRHIALERFRQHELRHAKDNMFASLLSKKPISEIDVIKCAEAVLKSTSGLRFDNEADPYMRKIRALLAVEISGWLGGIIAEMELHLKHNRYDLAYVAFLNFYSALQRAAKTPASTQVDINSYVAKTILSGFAEQNIRSEQDIISFARRSGGHPAQGILTVLKTIYAGEYYSDEERTNLLKVKDEEKYLTSDEEQILRLFWENEILALSVYHGTSLTNAPAIQREGLRQGIAPYEEEDFRIFEDIASKAGVNTVYFKQQNGLYLESHYGNAKGYAKDGPERLRFFVEIIKSIIKRYKEDSGMRDKGVTPGDISTLEVLYSKYSDLLRRHLSQPVVIHLRFYPHLLQFLPERLQTILKDYDTFKVEVGRLWEKDKERLNMDFESFLRTFILDNIRSHFHNRSIEGQIPQSAIFRIEQLAEPYQDVNDIEIEEIQKGEDGFESAIKIYPAGSDTSEKIVEQVRDTLVRENWWLQTYWREKGPPKEQVSISIGRHNVNIYNWNTEQLTDEQVTAIIEILKIFSSIADGKALEKCRYILIDNVQATNPVSGEEMNGYGAVYDRAIHLYPRALRPIEHRVKGVLNLVGTLIHELTHNIAEIIENDWIKKFGWQWIETPRKLPGGSDSMFQINNPGRCITEYAKSKPNEDICESMVAAIKNPDILDKERLDYLRGVLLQPLDDHAMEIAVNVERYTEDNITLPRIESPVKFRIADYIDIEPTLRQRPSPPSFIQRLIAKSSESFSRDAFSSGGGMGVPRFMEISGRKEYKYLLTKKMAIEDLPPDYPVSIREPNMSRTPPGYININLPDTDVFLVSETHSGSRGVVRLGWLDNGIPIAVKARYTFSKEEDNKKILSDYEEALLVDRLGIGPRVHGLFRDEFGRISIVMDIVPGDFPNVVKEFATSITIRDLMEINRRLVAVGRSMGFDIQYFITPQGRVQIIDPEGINDTGVEDDCSYVKVLCWLLEEVGDDDFQNHSLEEIAKKEPDLLIKIEHALEISIELYILINGTEPIERVALKRKVVEARRRLAIQKDIEFTIELIKFFRNGSMYELRYNAKRLSQSQQDLIEEYCIRLNKKLSGIKIKAIPVMNPEEDYIIKVVHKNMDRNKLGEGYVNIAGEDELGNYPLRMIGMLNIAFAAANVPDELTSNQLEEYRPLISFIQDQYRSIAGSELALPDSVEEMLKVIRKIELPKPEKIDIDESNRLNMLAKQILVAA